MPPLDALDAWTVDHAAGATFDRDGLRAVHGPTDRAFPLASVSKLVFAIAVQVAVEEGSVDLADEPVEVGAPPGVTVRHLLAHAGGLPPDGDRTPLGPPERKRIYSNVGFDILGDHLARVTGMSAGTYVRMALVDTLDLAHTSVDGSPAHGYRSSVHDLGVLVSTVVAGGLLAPSTVEDMTAPAFPDLDGVLPGFGAQRPNPWGLGVEIRGDKTPHWTAPENSVQTWGHFGRAGTFLWWDPAAGDDGLGLVVLTDREFGPWATEAWPALATAVLTAP